MTQESKAIRERLKACITRQRISFALFKRWYWESFDEDVQVNIHLRDCPYIQWSHTSCIFKPTRKQ